MSSLSPQWAFIEGFTVVTWTDVVKRPTHRATCSFWSFWSVILLQSFKNINL